MVKKFRRPKDDATLDSTRSKDFEFAALKDAAPVSATSMAYREPDMSHELKEKTAVQNLDIAYKKEDMTFKVKLTTAITLGIFGGMMYKPEVLGLNIPVLSAFLMLGSWAAGVAIFERSGRNLAERDRIREKIKEEIRETKEEKYQNSLIDIIRKQHPLDLIEIINSDKATSFLTSGTRKYTETIIEKYRIEVIEVEKESDGKRAIGPTKQMVGAAFTFVGAMITSLAEIILHSPEEIVISITGVLATVILIADAGRNIRKANKLQDALEKGAVVDEDEQIRLIKRINSLNPEVFRVLQLNRLTTRARALVDKYKTPVKTQIAPKQQTENPQKRSGVQAAVAILTAIINSLKPKVEEKETTRLRVDNSEETPKVTGEGHELQADAAKDPAKESK